MYSDSFVSVIVPIFNVERYISECIESVLGQSFRNLELILVDDGSPDGCPGICDAYAQKDKRVKVIHKKNGGLSDARNAGVANATGEYVLFLDGDDYWDDQDALQRLHDRIRTNPSDILCFSYKKMYEDTGETVPYFTVPDLAAGIGLTDQLNYLVDNGLYIASACNKLIRRCLLQAIQFEKDVYSEDITWCLDLIANAKSVDYVCENFYCYRQRSRSITHIPNNKRCADLAKAIIGCFSRAETADEKFKTLYHSYTAFQYATFVLVQAQAQEKQSKLIGELARYKGILKYHGLNKKLWCLRIVSMLFGYRGMCSLVRTAYRIKRR